MPVDPADRRVVALAGQRHGVVTAAQLAEMGLGRHAVAHRVAKGWLRRRHRGVYLVGPLETPFSDAMAAVLAYGDGALLSHAAAAVLWGLRPPPVRELHVTVAGRDIRSRDRIRAHSVADLHPADSTPPPRHPRHLAARALLDLAATATPSRARSSRQRGPNPPPPHRSFPQ